MNNSRLNICQKQEQLVLERSARLNLDPGRCDRGDGGDLDDREGGGGEIPADGGGRVNQPKVVQEVLADLKSKNNPFRLYCPDSLILSGKF